MAKFFIAELPDVLWHGSIVPLEEGAVCIPAAHCGWWHEIPWNDYDEVTDGNWRTAYANIVFEHLGLRCPGSPDIPEWAKVSPTLPLLVSNSASCSSRMIGYSSQTVETADRNFIGSRFPAC